MSQAAGGNSLVKVMGLRDFRLLFSGTALSLLGDQFALIATPWLVLQLTGDPMMLGIVLALTGLPRAGFMLIGGAITDRLSPRRIMLIADVVRLVLTALMAVSVLTGSVDIVQLMVFSLAFGTVAGFAVPAENSIVPMLVERGDLQAGNAVMMGVGQIAGFVGPSLAGILIGAYAQSATGVGYAYGLDALSFAVSALCLLLIRGARRAGSDGDNAPAGIVAAIRAALVHVWSDGALRLVFLILAAINFLLIGPLLVGIPLVAKTMLPEGAVAFGVLMSAFSVGHLVGFVAAGALPRPRALVIRAMLIGVLAGFALVVAVLGFVPSTLVDFVLLAGLGIGDGYVAILLFTWMQTRTPPEMLGRVMSFLMFASTGLVPLSEALSGALGKWNLSMMLVGAGALALVVTLWAALRPELSEFSDSLAATGTPAPDAA